MTGCAECDDQNLMFPDTLHDAARDLHRALHELIRPAERLLATRVLEPLSQALEG